VRAAATLVVALLGLCLAVISRTSLAQVINMSHDLTSSAGANGSITVLAGNATDLMIDINGYFAP